MARPALQVSAGRNLDAIADAIQSAERCDRYYAEDGEPCDGLDGCEDCLRLAGEAVIKLLERS